MGRCLPSLANKHLVIALQEHMKLWSLLLQRLIGSHYGLNLTCVITSSQSWPPTCGVILGDCVAFSRWNMAGGSMSQGRGREAFEGFITTDFSFLSLILGLPWCRKIISRRYFQNKHTKDETERQSWQPWWKLENQRHRAARMHSWVVDCRTLKDATQFLG